MLYNHFKTIAGNNDYRYLLKEGACIAERSVDGLPVLLFQNGRKYVELVLTRKGTDVVGTRMFTDIAELEPYLVQITLPSL